MEIGKFKKIEAILYEYKYIITEIKCLEIDLKKLEDEYRGCGAIDYSSESGKSNSFNSIVENEVVEREKEINKLKRKLIDKKATIAKIDIIVASLSEAERTLVEMRYLNTNIETWDAISRKLKFSTSHCSKIFRKKVIEKFTGIVK